MTEILTVTVNPAIDLATSVDHVVAGPKLRCAAARIDPGGGGVNVARAIGQLGGQATALVAVGGVMGDQLLKLLRAQGVQVRPVPISGDTRQNFAVTDESTGAQYRFGLPGGAFTQADQHALLDAVGQAAPNAEYVVLSGSLAPGLPVDFPSQVLAAIQNRAGKLIVDTSGPALNDLIAQPTRPVHVLRIDQKEAALASGQPIVTRDDSVNFATGLVNRGVAEIVVTGRGAEGSIMVAGDNRFFCHAPQVPVRSKIGAGDAFVAGLTLGLSRGDGPDRALQWGVAASSATVGTEGTALCALDAVQALLPQCVAEAIS